MEEIKTDQISSLLKDQLNELKIDLDISEVGEVIYVGDGVSRIQGLENVLSSELLEFPNNVFGMAMNLEEDNVGAVLFGDSRLVKEGDLVKRTGKVVQVGVGKEFLGRVINPLGQPVDGKGPIDAKEFLPIERKATGVLSRYPVKEPLQTGLKSVDAMIPIGRGQRELIIGDRQTGKTQVAIDAILNQKGQGVTCVYVAIGQKEGKVARIVNELKKRGAMDYTIVVASGASDPAAMQFLAPYAGCAMAEYFMFNKEHSLIVYDDLTKQANAYREMSLLLRRPPGREAYPGDVFYTHSRLLERASKLNEELGSGSMTALPIVETQAGDVSAYIPTNVISITDGQIFLESDLFNAGQKPAINVGLSVSRVGGSAQIKGMKKVAGTLKLDLAQYRELAAFSQFASDLDASTKAQLDRGERMMQLLKQSVYAPVTVPKQICAIYAGAKGYLDAIEVSKVNKTENDLYMALEEEKTILAAIESDKQIKEETEAKLKDIISKVVELNK